MNHTLISPLGLSPGAVSGVVFALGRLEEPVSIGRVVTVSTSHTKVADAAGYLRSVLSDAGLGYTADFIPQSELKESDDSVTTFVARLGAALDAAIAAKQTVHVAVTGGRAGMGALAALAASLYGADYLWHLWVPADTEKGGRVGKLQIPFTAENEYLNPPRSELVSLPFLDLRPLHPALWRYYHGESPAVLTDNSKLDAILTPFLHGQMQLADVFPGGVTTRQKQQVEAMAAAYPAANDQDQQQMQQKMTDILHRGGQVDEATRQAVESFMALDDPAVHLLERVSGEPGAFWRYLHDRADRIAAAAQASRTQINLTRVRQQLTDLFSLQELRTLATDLGVRHEEVGAGLSLSAFARELIDYMRRRQRLALLVGYAARLRPPLTQWLGAEESAPEQDEALVTVTESDLFLLQGLVAWLQYRDYGRPF